MIARFLRASLAAAAVASCLSPATAGEPPALPKTHHIKTVFLILMENHNWVGGNPERDIKGNPNAPYINNTLIPMASHAEEYFNPRHLHPSLPNYLWLEGGTNYGIRNDGPPKRNAQDTTQHLVTLLDNAGVSWKAYLEDTKGKNCPLHDTGPIDQDDNHLYAVRHEPFAYFNDVTDNQDKKSANCIAHLRPFEELAPDLKNDTISRYNFITPNLCNDMHDKCGGNEVAQGDAWLAENIPTIMASKAYQEGGAIFIAWDEGLGDDGPIPMILLSPYAKGNGYSNDVGYTHGSMLRTMQEIFGVRPFLGDAADEQDLSDLFAVFP